VSTVLTVLYRNTFDYLLTSMAILRLIDQIAASTDKGNLTIEVFINLYKDFYTIDVTYHLAKKTRSPAVDEKNESYNRK